MNLKVIGVTFLFLFAILFYSLRLSVAFFHYAIFNDNFTSLYCVNQDKPAMKCNGSCHLKKEAQKKTPDSNTTRLNDELHQTLVLFTMTLQKFEVYKIDYIKSKSLFFEVSSNLNRGYFDPDFQPPDLNLFAL